MLVSLILPLFLTLCVSASPARSTTNAPLVPVDDAIYPFQDPTALCHCPEVNLLGESLEGAQDRRGGKYHYNCYYPYDQLCGYNFLGRLDGIFKESNSCPPKAKLIC